MPVQAVTNGSSGASLPEVVRPRTTPQEGDQQSLQPSTVKNNLSPRQASQEQQKKEPDSGASLDLSEQAMEKLAISSQFSVFKPLNQIMVRVYNSKTDETIREIPNKKMLETIAGVLREAGLLVDEKR